MKQIPRPASEPQWNKSLLNDLLFIKKHLRYPLSRKTIPSFVVIFAFISLLIRLAWNAVILREKELYSFFWVISGVIIIVIGNFVYSYLSGLRFAAIPTPFFADRNRKLIENFLQSEQLLIYRHPDAPDVFQIASRPLGGSPDKREVFVFIADDKRILVNSHFTGRKFTIGTRSGNARIMTKRFRQWLASQGDGSNAIMPI